MPYASIADLPPAIRNLPKGLQKIYKGAFNSGYKESGDDSQAAQIAWAAVKKAGWQKVDGRWTRK